MDFNFTDEQTQLRDVLTRFLADRYSFEARHKILRSTEGWSPEIWTALADDLGIFGAALSEDVGGFGGGPVDTMLIMEAFGRALVVEPFLETVVIGAGLLRRSGSAVAPGALADIMGGTMITAFAWGEPGGGFDPACCATTARRDGDGWRLDGQKAVVIAAPIATHLIVTARGDAPGLSLFLVPRGTTGVTTTDYATVDGRRASEIAFDAVPLGADALLGVEGHALPLVERVLDEARMALCAEALGVLSELLRRTLDYVKARRQFGVPIGTFQVLRHRLVDMFMHVEQSISMTYMGTLKLDASEAERRHAVSAAKAFVGKACRFVGQNAVQTHGAIALTEELALSHYFKRAAMIESELGSIDFHLARFEAAAQAA